MNQNSMSVLLEVAPIGFALLDIERKIVYSNNACNNFLGVTREQSVGMLFPYDIREVIYEVDILRADGLNGMASLEFVKASGVGDGVLLATMTDITEHRKSKDVLARSEAKFRALAETTPDAIFIHRGDKFIYVNPTMAAMTGFSEDDLYKIGFVEIVSPDFIPEIADATGKRIKVVVDKSKQEIKLIKKNNEDLWVVISFTLIIYEGAMAILGVMMDISEIKRAQESLVANEKKYRTYIETSPEGFIVFYENGTILENNTAVCNMLGVSPTDFYAQKIQDFVDPSIKIKFEKEIAALASTGRASLELKLKKYSGEVFDVIFEAAKLEDGKFLAFINDISYKKTAERQIHQSEKLASIGSLVAGVAHEINNPLAVMKGNMYFLKDMLQTNYGKEHKSLEILDKIDKSARRIANIVDGLRMFARTDTDDVEEIDVHKAIEETVILVEGVYRHERIIIKTDIRGQNNIVMGNAGKFMQVLMNFISNAKDSYAGREGGGSIDVRTYDKGSSLVVEIEDHGCGIPDENKKKIFDAFFTTKDPGKGTGLGLSITSSIIQAMGGVVDLETRVGVGTNFKLTFPAHRAVVAAIETKKLSGKVLVFKTGEEFKVLVDNLLELGLSVDVVSDDIEIAYEKLNSVVFDIVFVDLDLPILEFFIREAKGIGSAKKFVGLTGGKEIPKEKREKYRTVFDGYIRKNYEISELYANLATYLKKV